MKRKLRNGLFFAMAVIGLQQVSHLLGEKFGDEREIIQSREIDPSAFFYTESEEALRAEKAVRDKLVGPGKNDPSQR